MIHNFLQMIYFDLKVTMRQAFTWITPLLFFVIIICFYPLALGPNKFLLAETAPAIIWISALLAILISIGSLFRYEQQEGCLELLLLSPYPLTLLVFAKVTSHWLTHCLPLILISPLLGYLLGLSSHEQFVLFLTLCLGTPVLTFFGAIGAALMIGVRQQGLLLPILIMPFYIPVIIFSTGTLLAASHHQPLNAYFAILTAFMLLCFAFAPVLTAIALRNGVNQ